MHTQSHCITPTPLFLHLPQFLSPPPLQSVVFTISVHFFCVCVCVFASCSSINEISISCLHLAAHCGYYVCSLSRILRSSGIPANTHICVAKANLNPPSPPSAASLVLTPILIPTQNPNPDPTNPLKKVRKGQMSSLCICECFFSPQSN